MEAIGRGPEGLPESVRGPRRIPWVMILFHLALGGVAVALAVSDDFAEGKAVFYSDAWRALLGLVGAALLFLALRGVFRNLNDSVPELTEARARSGRIGGRVLLVVGLGLLLVTLNDDFASRSIAFESWARTQFIWGGGYLTLLGLLLQLNPSGALARRRVATGLGVPGIATIQRADDTGTTVGESPVVDIALEVDSQGRRLPARTRVVMEQAKLALLIPGSTVDVVVDRENPNALEIDWDSWRGPGSG